MDPVDQNTRKHMLTNQIVTTELRNHLSRQLTMSGNRTIERASDKVSCKNSEIWIRGIEGSKSSGKAAVVYYHTPQYSGRRATPTSYRCTLLSYTPV